MDPSDVLAIFASATASFWSYITALVPSYILFLLGLAFVAIVIWVVMKAPRKVING